MPQLPSFETGKEQPTFEDTPLGQIPHSGHWISRPLGDSSSAKVGEVAASFPSHEVIRRLSGYAMALVYATELNEVIKQAGKASSPALQMTPREIYDELLMHMPDSLFRPKQASVLGLGHYNNRVAIDIDYPQFEEERTSLTQGINEILDLRDTEWNAMQPHINVARRKLATSREFRPITNLEAIEASLPPEIYLAPISHPAK